MVRGRKTSKFSDEKKTAGGRTDQRNTNIGG